jgi:transposase-like protein
VQVVAGMSRTRSTFVPPHCPRSSCRYHGCADGWRWIRFGSYTRLARPQVIPRFRCVACGVTFSTQTFATTYYLKRPELLEPLFHRLLAGSGLRQITREARCSHRTLVGQAARLGRHALLLLAQNRPSGPLAEPVVIDGFESFAYSQYHPLHLHLVVGAASHYTYAFTLSRLRRKGRMTAGQKRRRAALEARHGRPDPRALVEDMAAALRIAAPRPQALVVRSDEHPLYPPALRRLPEHGIRHEMTPSVEARTAGNPLFPVNLMDLLLRHHSANHKREGIAFSKRHQAVIERAALLVAWRNFGKRFSENHDGGTPAMRLGLTERLWSVRRMLRERRFATRVALPPAWSGYYRGEVDTPGIARPRRHRLLRAF